MGEEDKKGGEEKVEEKKADEEKKIEAAKKEDEKKVDEAKVAPPPPPPPPQVIVLRVYMHCEGCARKVRACLKGFPGVEDVETDCKSHTVVVKGEKADPLKVVARVQRKSHRQVQLLSPIPKPPAPEPAEEEIKTTEVKEVAKPEEKKEEPQVITVVLKVHMHCEACAQEIKKRMMRMKGVENAEPDLKNSQVTVKGVFEPLKLVEYVYKRTGKHAVVVKQDPEKIEFKEDKKGEEGGDKDKDVKKGEEAAGDGKEKKEGGGEEAAKAEASTSAEQEDAAQGLDMKKNEFYYYHPQNYQMYPPKFTPAESYSSYSYPPAPQMFSDENPNACSVM